MAADGDLYHSDFFAWTQAQGRAIRGAASGGNAPIDWDNVAEEIESLGRTERRELSSRIATIIEHLLKLSCSPAAESRRGWMQTVRRTRGEVEDVLADSPSLRPEVPSLIVAATARAARRIADDLDAAGEATPEVLARLRAITLTPDHVLGDWLPDRPG